MFSNNISGYLTRWFGFDSLRDSQEPVVKSVLGGNDTLALLATSAGKSLCFQLPAIMAKGTTIVISPLLSLMHDQVEGLKRKGIGAELLSSEMTEEEYNSCLDKLKANKLKLLYISPERLCLDDFLNVLVTVDVSFFVFDEAHCVSMWGNDFRPAYKKVGRKILELESALAPIKGQNFRFQKVALTGTATSEIVSEIKNSLYLNDSNVISGSFDRPNLSLNILISKRKEDGILETLKRCHALAGSKIIYCRTRVEVESTYRMLKTAGFSVARYHGGMSKAEKEHNFSQFMSSRSEIVVATCAFGMGVDKPDIRLVIHRSAPVSLEDYFQQVGRLSRDGYKGTAILLHNPKMDGKWLLDFVRSAYTSRKALDAIKAYCLIYESKFGSCGVQFSDKVLGKLNKYGSKQELRTAINLLVESGFLSTRHEYCLEFFIEDKYAECNLQSHLLAKSSAVSRAQSVITFIESKACRRYQLLKYLGESVTDDFHCGLCDSCNSTNKRPTSAREMLSNLVSKISAERSIPTFVVLSKRAQEMIVEDPPKDLKRLSLLPGMNNKKIEAFGNEILSFIHANY